MTTSQALAFLAVPAGALVLGAIAFLINEHDVRKDRCREAEAKAASREADA